MPPRHRDFATATTGEPRALAPAVFGDERRRVYPFSVIRGGAFSKEELLRALASDPIAESHYAVLQMDRLHPVRSAFVSAVYVSYRKDNAIYWTSHPLKLHEGETLLTDGNLFARARCGNRISLSSQLPVARMEPAPEMLDPPEEIKALPESLMQAVAQIEPAPDSLTRPEDLATSASKASSLVVPGNPFFGWSLVQVLPVPVTTQQTIKTAPPGGIEPTEPPLSSDLPIDPIYAVTAAFTPIDPIGAVTPAFPTFVPNPPIPPIIASPIREHPGFPYRPSEAVPEPPEWVLVASAAGAFLLVRARRRLQHRPGNSIAPATASHRQQHRTGNRTAPATASHRQQNRTGNRTAP